MISKDLLKDTVILHKPNGTDRDGNTFYETETLSHVRVELAESEVMGSVGKVEKTKGTLFFDYEESVGTPPTPGCKITYRGVDYTIGSCRYAESVSQEFVECNLV